MQDATLKETLETKETDKQNFDSPTSAENIQLYKLFDSVAPEECQQSSHLQGLFKEGLLCYAPQHSL